MNYFNGKTVLITGHTGFKGSWLCIWLNSLGAKVVGASINIPTAPSNFLVSNIKNVVEDVEIDIKDKDAIKLLIKKVQPDYVFHLAAQALVRPSYDNPFDTMMTNAMGTVNLLEGIRCLNKNIIVVMITSDKAYDNVEWIWGYKETDRLGGKDPYSASKGMAELAIRSYINSFFNHPSSGVRVGIGRAGNVIGGGDWAIDRIVPDCVEAWAKNKSVDIRNPNATRPWQHVLEPLSGYLALDINLSLDIKNHGEAYNFGPPSDQNFPVRDLINEMSSNWDKVKWNDISENNGHVHEAGLLKLNCDKALSDLNWQPTLKFKETVEMTVEWYKHYYQNKDQSMYDFTLSQIDKYTEIAFERSIKWTIDD